MKFKVDENLPDDVARKLSELGNDASTVHDENLTGAQDENLISVCKHEARIMITLDTDFSNIKRYPPKDYQGIIIIRTRSQDRDSLLRTIERLHNIFESNSVRNKLWIVEEDRIRIRE